MNTKTEIAVVNLDSTSETHLWQAVITDAIEEWTKGPMRRQQIAEQYLFHSTDFAAVCQSAGMNAEYLRSKLRKLRARTEREIVVPLAA
jgi:hypothetical protein